MRSYVNKETKKAELRGKLADGSLSLTFWLFLSLSLSDFLSDTSHKTCGVLIHAKVEKIFCML
jgi:hypothetical protein